MVFRLAIVEDEKQDSDLLQSHIHHFFTENCPDDSFQVTVFDNAGVFIEQYRPDYDLIFWIFRCRASMGWKLLQL